MAKQYLSDDESVFYILPEYREMKLFKRILFTGDTSDRVLSRFDYLNKSAGSYKSGSVVLA